jgi:hypothetical protein
VARRKLNYDLGSVISVEDETGKRLALCRVEAANGKGVVIGRFFWIGNEVRSGYWRLEGIGFLWKFGDLHVISGRWPVLGVDGDYFPSPDQLFHFLNSVPVKDRSWVTTYDVNAKELKHVRVLDIHKPELPSNDLKGAGFVEARLKQVIAGTRSPLD